MTSIPAAVAADQPYAFDNASPAAAAQVRLLAGILDDDTIAALATIPIAEGWRCLDVGPGAGTITACLAETVGDDGHVTALDINPQHVRGADNVDIVTADIRTADLPDGHYDLIHARLVLTHLPTRFAVLDRLVTALRPGGWLVIGEWDFTHPDDMALHLPTPQAADAFTTYQRTLTRLVAARGADAAWARRAPLAMRTAGLVDVHATVTHRLWYGGQPGCLLHKSNSHQLHQQLLDAGMTRDQLTVLREAMGDPDTMTWQFPLVTTVGHRPAR